MPFKPKRPCRHPGCKNLSDGIYCDEHRQYRENRLSATKRGYDSRWRHARNMYLKEHPLCVECLKDGKANAATVVDHIVPHRGDQTLFWDINNWQPLCKDCHDKKTGSGM